MYKSESIEDFYKKINEPETSQLLSRNKNEVGHFNVYSRAASSFIFVPYNRRDYYKISLIIGTGVLNYANKAIKIDKNALIFSNPLIPYSKDECNQ